MGLTTHRGPSTTSGAQLLLAGRAVIVAGGGRGIGRACSKLLAEHGAHVLLVDPGVAYDGTGRDSGVAASVAAEITAAGGTAVGCADAIGSFADGERVVARCRAEFGSVDAVVAAAAILRDRMIFNLTEADWHAVLNVNLSAVFGLVRAACVLMRQQRFGRIVTFTSAAGFEGVAGTSNYAAAKMGIVGLTKAVASDMAKYGVRINCICPRADTRLTEHVAATRPSAAASDSQSLGRPEDVATLAVYLASDECRTSGRIFYCGGGQIGVYADFVPKRLVAITADVPVNAVSRVVEQLLFDAN